VVRPSFLAVLSILATFLCLAPPCRAADPAPGTDTTKVFTLYLEHGVTRRVVHIEPRADGMAAITAKNGTIDYIPLNKIKRVEDPIGVDRTSDVLRRGRRLGPQVPRPDDSAWKSFRFHPEPGRACGSYLITETSILSRTSGPSPGKLFVSLDYGYARNVGDATSLGGTVFVGGDDDVVRSGLRIRYVRWLRPNLSLDVAPGIVLLANEKGTSRFKSPGFSSQVGLNLGGRIGLVAQVASVARREAPSFFAPPDTTVHETDWHLGVRLGGGLGVFGTAALVGRTILVLASFSNSGF